MTLSATEVAKIAALARLKLTADETAVLGRQLSAVVDYFDQLAAVDVADVEPLAHPLPLQNVFRDDVVRPGLPIDAALANAPKRAGDFYSVPAILD